MDQSQQSPWYDNTPYDPCQYPSEEDQNQAAIETTHWLTAHGHTSTAQLETATSSDLSTWQTWPGYSYGFTTATDQRSNARHLSGPSHETMVREQSSTGSSRTYDEEQPVPEDLNCPHNTCKRHTHRYKRIYELERHLETCHGEKSLYCPVDACSRSRRGRNGGFGRLDNLNEHLRRMHDRVAEDTHVSIAEPNASLAINATGMSREALGTPPGSSNHDQADGHCIDNVRITDKYDGQAHGRKRRAVADSDDPLEESQMTKEQLIRELRRERQTNHVLVKTNDALLEAWKAERRAR